MFLPVTFVRIEIERWEWSESVSFAKMYRLICNMAYLAQNVTSRYLDLRSNSDLDFLRSTFTHFDAFRREEHDAPKIISIAFLVQKLLVKTLLCKQHPILTFLDFFSITR